MSAISVNDAQSTRTVIEEDARCERRTQPVAARDVVDRLARVHERVGGLQRREWARDDFVLPRCSFRMVHLHLDSCLAERVHDLFEDLRLLATCGQRVRVAPPMCVRRPDGQRFREQDEFGLKTHKELDAGGILSVSKQVRSIMNAHH